MVAVLERAGLEPEQIDEAIVGFRMPMGPFTVADALGLDVVWSVAHKLHEAYGGRMAPALLLRRRVEAGRTGERSGAGSYGYGDETVEALAEMIQAIQEETGIRGPSSSWSGVSTPFSTRPAAVCRSGSSRLPTSIWP